MIVFDSTTLNHWPCVTQWPYCENRNVTFQRKEGQGS